MKGILPKATMILTKVSSVGFQKIRGFFIKIADTIKVVLGGTFEALMPVFGAKGCIRFNTRPPKHTLKL